MLIWVLFLGLFTLSFGLLLVLSPDSLRKMSEGMNKVFQGVDTQVMGNRVGVGIALVLLSVFLFYYAFSLGVR